MKNLETLQKELSEHSKKCDKLRIQISDMKKQDSFLTLKKKYEGKYWSKKGINTYSFCIKLMSPYHGIFHHFTNDSLFKFNLDSAVSLDDYCQQEITKEEYLSALEDFKAKVNELGNFK